MDRAVQRRELIRDLKRAGLVLRKGSGSHRRFWHPTGARTLSGGRGDDAKAYQELDVARAIRESKDSEP